MLGVLLPLQPLTAFTERSIHQSFGLWLKHTANLESTGRYFDTSDPQWLLFSFETECETHCSVFSATSFSPFDILLAVSIGMMFDRKMLIETGR